MRNGHDWTHWRAPIVTKDILKDSHRVKDAENGQK